MRMIGTNALVGRGPGELAYHFLHMRAPGSRWLSMGKNASEDTEFAGALILDFLRL